MSAANREAGLVPGRLLYLFLQSVPTIHNRKIPPSFHFVRGMGLSRIGEELLKMI